MTALALLSLAGILLILHADFRSVRLALLLAVSLPFALIGGVLSLGSLVGFVTVLGIAARNGIMLLSHYRHLQEQEGVPFGLGLALRGAGQEIEHPMAVVILGGLATSTVLNLFVMPALKTRDSTLNSHFPARKKTGIEYTVPGLAAKLLDGDLWLTAIGNTRPITLGLRASSPSSLFRRSMVQ